MGHTGTGPMGTSNAPYRHPDLGPEIEFPPQVMLEKRMATEPRKAEIALPTRKMLEPRLYFHIPLRDGNRFEFILDRRVSKDEFENIKKIVDLMEASVVETELDSQRST